MNIEITQSNARAAAPVLDRSPEGAPLASEAPLRNGPAAATILAAGIGAAFLGIIAIGEAAIPPLSKALIFSKAVGPLSGKSTVAMVAWLGVWAVLHWLWRERHIRFRPVAVATVVLVIVGLLGTFPPVFDFIDDLVNWK
jgi:hypothetical protein